MPNNIWWITKEKRHLPETKIWWCSHCNRRTPIERNPEWNGEFSGERPAPKWFTRCARCKHEHWQTQYGCDNCGWDDLPEWVDGEKPKALIEVSNTRSYTSLDIIGTALDWDETWKCPKCKNIFTFTNGNY